MACTVGGRWFEGGGSLLDLSGAVLGGPIPFSGGTRSPAWGRRSRRFFLPHGKSTSPGSVEQCPLRGSKAVLGVSQWDGLVSALPGPRAPPSALRASASPGASAAPSSSSGPCGASHAV